MEEDPEAEIGPNQKQRRHSTREHEKEPIDTDPTDAQYIKDNEYCVQILAEPIPARWHHTMTECQDQHIHGSIDNIETSSGLMTPAEPSDAHMNGSTNQPHSPQSDLLHIVRIYAPDDGNQSGFTTLRRQPNPQLGGFTTLSPLDQGDHFFSPSGFTTPMGPANPYSTRLYDPDASHAMEEDLRPSHRIPGPSQRGNSSSSVSTLQE
jgi:hypothetical protein